MSPRRRRRLAIAPPGVAASALALAAAALVALAAGGDARATGGVYTLTKHGDPSTGVQRVAGLPAGDCGHCHDAHASRDGSPTGGPHPYALFAPADDALCAEAGCHVGPGAAGIFPGPSAYAAAVHATSPQTVWPGPEPRARAAGDAGRCVNCHTPHGRGDALGTVPALLSVREQGSCNACHDASGPSTFDVASDLTKPHRHPILQHDDRHVPGESAPADFAFSRRHAECADCHNPHDVAPDAFPPVAPEASARIGRVSRVSVANGAAGTEPVYTFRAADDPAPVLEHEVCFKCHSSWTDLPGGRADLALLTNPNNPSYHPVQAAGADPKIAAESFAGGRQATDTLFCSDCHGSDDPGRRGPHGSLHAGLLVAPFPATPAPRTMDPDELCFGCHRWEVYADDGAPAATQAASRWNEPAAEGHAEHAAENVACFSCHEVHGSTTLPHLLATGRSPGIVLWSAGAGGTRTCTPTCHQPETYAVNY